MMEITRRLDRRSDEDDGKNETRERLREMEERVRREEKCRVVGEGSGRKADLAAFKIMILTLKTKNAPGYQKDDELDQLHDEESCQALSDHGDALHADDSTISNRLKSLG
ncbi:hypothetical protein O3M35_007528 [Rhynocoris fuscipes]|uniref:Uncharacterized protein n=1 Tax=Rhynocoris fuscipes TaxID=488301 RepID=A0AAW1DGY2_9HEMI